MEKITEWIDAHRALLEQLGIVSLIVLAITAVALPVVVILLPQDYFTAERRGPSRSRQLPLVWATLSLFKNLLGILLILVGLVLLVLPGQGVLTILIGLALTNFPGKYTLERRIVGQPTVAKTLNRIRELGGAPPLSLPTKAE